MQARPIDPVPDVPPPGFALRRPTWNDLDAVAALYAASSLERIGRVTVRRGDLRVRWLELESFEDALLVESPPPDPVVAAYADFQTELGGFDDDLRLYVDGRVHPAFPGRGLSSFLLRRAVVRAADAARLASVGSAALRTTVVDGDDGARGFLTRHGFHPIRHLLQMHLDLHAAPPAPAWPPGVVCRSFRPGSDDVAVWTAHQAAFADVATHLPIPFEAWRESRIDHEPGFDPDLVFLAEAETEIVGIAVCREGSEAAAEDGLVRDLGVVPAWRRRGVGMALLRTAFEAFRSRGLSGAALEVDDVTLDGAASLYRRAGMRVTHRTDVLERTVAASEGSSRSRLHSRRGRGSGGRTGGSIGSSTSS